MTIKLNPPTKDKTWETIRTIENNKSPAENNISAQFIKYGDRKLWEEIPTMIEVAWA
jgi:hypothetical protein